MSNDFLTSDDKVVLFDDFLTYGNATCGIIDHCSQAGSVIVAMGFVLEKEFQGGGDQLRYKGCDVESLAIIDSLDN